MKAGTKTAFCPSISRKLPNRYIKGTVSSLVRKSFYPRIKHPNPVPSFVTKNEINVQIAVGLVDSRNPNLKNSGPIPSLLTALLGFKFVRTQT